MLIYNALLLNYIRQIKIISWSPALYVHYYASSFACITTDVARVEMPFGGGAESGGSNEPCVRWSPDPPREGAPLRGDMFRSIITYLPQANVPAQPTRRTNAFSAARGDKVTRQRPGLLPNHYKHLTHCNSLKTNK